MMLDTKNATPEEIAELLDIASVARLCGCSARTIRRLADAGRMPRPLKLGALLRWRRAELESWIEAGCPSNQAGARQQ